MPCQPCRRCGASSTRVAASESCTATESMPHHRASHARAVEQRSRGETLRLRHSASSRFSKQQVSLQRPPTSHARTISWHLCDRRSSGYFVCLRSSASAMATPSTTAARGRASPMAISFHFGSFHSISRIIILGSSTTPKREEGGE